jgi:hypothetical protein
MGAETTKFQGAVDRWLDAGEPFDLIESEVVNTAPLDDDQRAALWLYAWHKAATEQRPPPSPPGVVHESPEEPALDAQAVARDSAEARMRRAAEHSAAAADRAADAHERAANAHERHAAVAENIADGIEDAHRSRKHAQRLRAQARAERDIAEGERQIVDRATDP